MRTLITPAIPPNPDDPHPERQALAAARAHAPYLARLLAHFPDDGARLEAEEGAESVFTDALGAIAAAGHAPIWASAQAALRIAKARAHLAIAMGDLSGRWGLERVTGALSQLAQSALEAAVALIARRLAEEGACLPPPDHPGPEGMIPGLILLAMGKLGAEELNYSSDIDVTVFFDKRRFPTPDPANAQRTAVRAAQYLVALFEERTAEGYVFRTDLRLRPDPGATPIAVSLAAAEHYYQTLGQNWERAAFIKARPIAADLPAGADFLSAITPFLWRKHLDYAAIADIRAIKTQIRAVKDASEFESVVFDVKLGRGGIRDIELFVQTQQLILGGRKPSLRARETLHALSALTAEGQVRETDRAVLESAYRFWRGVEHRIQMLEDEQTHKIPASEETRARLAALCGFASLHGFDDAVIATRRAVAEIDGRFFTPDQSLADRAGSLSFTGVEDDPDTVETLIELGYRRPQDVTSALRAWHHGRIPAMRTARARELLTAITPKLLRTLAESGEADLAFARFSAFFTRLNAGVQALSLLREEPTLIAKLARALALSERLAEALGRRPQAFDAMTEPRFAAPIAHDPEGERADLFATQVAAAGGFEPALNVARRLWREEAFRIDWQTLQGQANAEDAGRAHADLAEAVTRALSSAAAEETARRFGPPPGEFVILALGKFGGRELAEGSDLDLMVVFDAPRESGAAEYFTRFTQRLITALSSPTEEGLLYEVDMQLRPSGSKGPVAVRRSAFNSYYQDEAWTWEHLALTRARPVAGDAALSAALAEDIAAILQRPRDRAKLTSDAADMRARMEKERPGKGLWDLKLQPGALVDIEFIAQTLQLAAASAHRDVLRANTGEALRALKGCGALSSADAGRLHSAWALHSGLQQVLRVAAGETFAPAHASEALKARLADVGGAESFAALETLLAARQSETRAIFRRLIG